MPKREQIVTPLTVANLPSDNPRPILVEFIREFLSFAKRIVHQELSHKGGLIQCVDMRADETIRKAAVGKKYLRMLAVVSTELVAAKACYHKSCYHNYTRNIPVNGDKKEDSEHTEYSRAELQGYEKLFNYWD